MSHNDNHCDDLKPDAMECLQRGHRQLAPGVYKCADGDLHVSGPEVCRAAGVPITRANMERLGRAAMERFKEPGPFLVVE